MNKFLHNHLYVLIVTICLVTFLSACGSNDNSTESEKNTESSSEAVIESAKGEFAIPKDTERILAPFHEDALLALDVEPVAKWAIGNTIQDYLEPEMKDLPKLEWNLPLEQVLQYEPDLIIVENNLDSYEGTYDDYNKIAPTYVMTEETMTDWRKQLEVFGQLVDKEDAAKQALEDYEETVANASTQLKEAIGEDTVAVIWAIGNQFFLFEKNRHSAEVIYSELGLQYPALIEELGEAEAQWNPISVEKLSELDADHVFLLATEDEQGLETLENSEVWKSTPAAKNGQVYIVHDASNWTNKGLIASKRTIESMLDILVK
ncbi:iron-hydroxamate ABC transporter substrate-binding protein [Paucisalibacillus globulus]|jgi:iron complex transport system substrate-binding protein|uniref:iron-hydroxamate ABC transporter substrate-binding protein n=1 Tax=Paucisalibacillus globulus TaxID=351095 RepID=UPI0004165273|nr:iron-hydroxamate ABC transporter substrate-binding protein [Paucisalibacillus globulus]